MTVTNVPHIHWYIPGSRVTMKLIRINRNIGQVLVTIT